MRRKLFLLLALSGLTAPAVMLDRIAILVQKAIIKDSDINRDVRVTDFLNGTPVVFDLASRKQSAGRLIDQTFIRDEILTGEYPRATLQDADKQIAAFTKERFHSPAAFEAALQRDGISEEDVRLHVQWQLTVLNFIDARFKPAAYVSDQEITAYYNEHAAALKRQFPGRSSLDQLRGEITNRIAGEKVNQLFFSWLDGARKSGHIEYREASLR
jgi:hypothetical protein